jgi:hypothetical protein
MQAGRQASRQAGIDTHTNQNHKTSLPTHTPIITKTIENMYTIKWRLGHTHTPKVINI